MQTTFRDAALTLAPKAFDNFLAKLIPGDGLRVGFDVALGRSSTRGSYIQGKVPTIGTGGERPTPPAPQPAPPGTPPALPPLPPEQSSGLGHHHPDRQVARAGDHPQHQLGVDQGGSDAAPVYLVEVTTSASVRIGPVTARVDRFGVKLEISLPSASDARANLGFMNLEVAPRAPDGVALAIDVEGRRHRRRLPVPRPRAGALRRRDAAHDPGAHHVKAFGLIATKLPDGSKGYSLIVFITAEDFRPIPLGMGFTLHGHRRHARDQPHVRRRRRCARG